MALRGWGCWISPCTERRAQATVEAAFLLPCFLTLLLLALQPVCLLYTRAAMESAASATARLMCTGEGEDAAYAAFVQRRLAAVPNVSIFHVGGPLAWDIELARAAEDSGAVRVVIEGRARLLPVLGAFAGAVGAVRGDEVALRVEVAYAARPEWLEGSYGSWVEEWG